MHLLSGQPGRVDEGDEAVDLGQSPGDIVILSSADSELSLLAAQAAVLAGGPSLRLASLLRLAHPLSVDLYCDQVIAEARLVVVRLMGGTGYWPYGVDRLAALARGGGPALVVIPGEDRWDPGLEALSTLPPDTCRTVWRYLTEGGATNSERLLRYLAALIGRGAMPPPPLRLPRAGAYWPGAGPVDIEALADAAAGRPVVGIVFYRTLVQSAFTAPVDALVAALAERGLAAAPVFVASLKDGDSIDVLDRVFARLPPDIVLNGTAFAVSRPGPGHAGTPLDRPGRPVLQIIFSGSGEAAWQESAQGLSARDLTMNVIMPEIDGRILTRTVSFKEESAPHPLTGAPVVTYRPHHGRIGFVADLAAAWVRLARRPAPERRIVMVLSNYPDRDGRIANGVGLDTPQSAVTLLQAMKAAGYGIGSLPETSADLMKRILSGWTNASARSSAAEPAGTARHPLVDYAEFFATLPKPAQAAILERWGPPEADPQVADGAFRLALHRLGNVVIAIQPARGYGVDPKATYHVPDLVPPHHYLAFYDWLRRSFRADAVVHLGKHGNLEWLPGKALGLSASCWPEIALGPTPLIYPFIVNDPGEGAQAKRRAAAVIVDHLMPPLTRAETYGPLAELETLIDEYYLAVGVDPRRRAHLEREILATAARTGLDRDLGMADVSADDRLRVLDAHLCELKDLSIRDGLHVLGGSPAGRQRIDTLCAIARMERSGGRRQDRSLHRALAADLGLDGFDPLAADLAEPWTGPRPDRLAGLVEAPWRTAGDTVERLEVLAAALVAEVAALAREDSSGAASPSPAGGGGSGRGPAAGSAWELDTAPAQAHTPSLVSPPQAGERTPADRSSRSLSPTSKEAGAATSPSPAGGGGSGWGNAPEATGGAGSIGRPDLPATRAALDWIVGTLAPALDRSGAAEIGAVLAALDGRFVPPGPSGAPSRGRPEVLPTGRNFYSVDIRGVPTAAAWALGRAAADAFALRYFQDEGDWPRAIALSAWGTSNMRTGGDDIAQALALIGAAPVWEPGTGRVTGFDILPLSALGRPRIDVTLRISGMFRDAFPVQIDLLDSAMRAVAALDEPADANPVAAAARATRRRLEGEGVAAARAARQAASRIFGAKPGAYGSGMQALIDEGGWSGRRDFADAFLAWGGFAYGGGVDGEAAAALLAERLGGADAVLHNQDNREHDILDSDDYYQFQGGLAATVEVLSGRAPRLYHGDHSRPETPRVRSLTEEIGRVVRGRAANPKWIAGAMRHGYKGAFEMAATVDYLFGFAATTDAVADHHFDILYDAYLGDPEVRAFITEANRPALAEMAARFREAIDRGLWAPASNSAYDRLNELAAAGRPARSAPAARPSAGAAITGSPT